MKMMEDATRFYNFFHLRLSPDVRELPDHITTELEFLHYLTFREAEVAAAGRRSVVAAARRARLPRAPPLPLGAATAGAARQAVTVPFFTALVEFAIAFFERDRAYAAAAAGN